MISLAGELVSGFLNASWFGDVDLQENDFAIAAKSLDCRATGVGIASSEENTVILASLASDINSFVSIGDRTKMSETK